MRYINAKQLFEDIKTTASVHRRKVLERYFQKPYNNIDPELYKELKIVETRRSKLPGRPAIKREHYFHTLDNHHFYDYKEENCKELGFT